MPKKYTQEEIKRLKDELFAKTVYFRDHLKDCPQYPFNISDEQIRSNIEKKFSIYLKAKEYSDSTVENEIKIAERLKKDNPNYIGITRGSFFAAHTEEQYDDLLKQTNTHAKNEHYRQKIIKDILSCNSQELVGATLDIEKAINFAENNRINIECGYQTTAITNHGTGGTLFAEDIKSHVEKNKLLYETSFGIIRDNIHFASNPLYYLFEDTNPVLDEEKTANLIAGYDNSIFSTQNSNPLATELKDALNRLFPNPGTEKFKKIQNTLEAKGYTNLLYLKSSDKTKSVVQSLIDNDELKPLDSVEKRKLDEEFNKFEIAVIYEKINSKPGESLPITQEEKEKFNKFLKESENPNLDVFEKVNLQSGTKFTLNNFNEEYEKKYGKKQIPEAIDENAEGKTYADFKNYIVEKALEGSDLTAQNEVKPLSATDILRKDRANYIARNGLQTFHNNLCSALTLGDARTLVANKDKEHEKENVEKFYKDVALKLKSYGANGFTDFSSSFTPSFFVNYTDEEKLNFLVDRMGDIKLPKTPNGFKNELFKDYVSIPKDLTQENINNYFSNVEKVLSDINRVKIPKNYQYEFPHNLGERADEHCFNNIIDETREKFEKEGNQEVLAALNECNNILKQGIENYNPGNTAEMMGNNSAGLATYQMLEYVKTKDYFDKKDFFISTSGAQFLFNKDAPIEKKSQFFKDANRMTVQFSKESQEKALGLYNSITHSKYNYKTPIQTLKQQGVQTWIEPLRTKMEKAIIEKDGKSIVDLVKQYRDCETEADNLYKQIREHDSSDFIPSNISFARNRQIPQKYRNDIITTSKFNGLLNMLHDQYTSNIDFKELLVDDPLSVYKQMQEDNLNNAIEKVNNFTKQESLTDLLGNYIFNNENELIAEFFDNQEGTFNRLLRGAEAIPILLGSPSGQDFNMKSTFLNVALIDKFEQIKTFATSITSNKEFVFDNATRFILAEREDRDFFKINCDADKNLDFDTYEPRPKFNKTDYVRTKTTAPDIIFRSIETYKRFNEPELGESGARLVNCAKDVLDYIPEDLKTPSVNQAVSLIKSGKVNQISSELMSSLKNEAALTKMQRNGINKDNVREAFVKLADVEKKYNSRNFLSKWFGSNVKKEKALIDKTYQQLQKDTGLSLKDLQKIVEKGRTDKLTEFANSVGDLQRSLATKEHNEELDKKFAEVNQHNTFKRAMNNNGLMDDELENQQNNRESTKKTGEKQSIVIIEGKDHKNSSFSNLTLEEKEEYLGNEKSDDNFDLDKSFSEESSSEKF